jgi:Leucine-rich repeat (LRR) protein
MKDSLDPNSIYQKIIKNRITKFEAIEFLVSIIEKSDDTSLRLESLNVLNKLNVKNQAIFKIIESCLISDEYEDIRIISAEIILSNYLEVGLKSLEWVILNDKSPKVLSLLGHMLKNRQSYLFEVLNQIYFQRIEQIALKYNLVPEEVPFLLDLGFNIDNNNLFYWESINKMIYAENIVCIIKDKHILELSLSLRNQLPSSISLLKNLKYLNLSCNYLTNLPDSLSELSHLENIDLSWNNFSTVPDVLSNLKSIEKINFRNNNIQELPNWLSLLDKI